MDDYYILDTDPNYCDSVLECGACPQGMICNSASNPSGQILEDALILEGWFRFGNTSLHVTQCPEPSTQCVGNATFGDALCANGHEGPFCMVCKLQVEKRYVWSGQKCTLCDGSSRHSLYGGLACLGLVVVGLPMYLLQSGKGKSLPGKTTSKTAKMEAFFEIAQTKYKILITFTQILSKVATLYPVQLPSKFLSFWGHFSVLSVDLSVVPVNCIMDSNFHDRLVATTVAPVGFLFGMLTLWLVQRQLIKWGQKEGYHASLAKLTSKTLRLSIIFIFTVFPMVSTTIFQVKSRTIALFSCFCVRSPSPTVSIPPASTDFPVRYTTPRLGIFNGGLQDPTRRPRSPHVCQVRCLDGSSVLLWHSRRVPVLSEQKETGDPDASDAF
jgi:hypothetical protein